jgi:hypothetical protein
MQSGESALKKMSAALDRICEPGLSKTEIMRLQAIGVLGKRYREGLSEYLLYRNLEVRLVDMERKYEEAIRKIEALVHEKKGSVLAESAKVGDGAGSVSASDSSSKPA